MALLQAWYRRPRAAACGEGGGERFATREGCLGEFGCNNERAEFKLILGQIGIGYLVFLVIPYTQLFDG